MASTFVASEFERKIDQALRLDLPYAERLLRPADLHAAVLALFGYSKTGEPALLITRRTDSLQSHQGQMSFPGGRCDPDELERRDFAATALRETQEEVGIPPENVRMIGHLPDLTTVTQYEVTPYVGILEPAIEEQKLRIAPEEVAEAFWIPWSILTSPAIYQKEMIQRGAIRFPTHVYTFEGRRIWGATGAMIKNLLDRLQRIG